MAYFMCSKDGDLHGREVLDLDADLVSDRVADAEGPAQPASFYREGIGVANLRQLREGAGKARGLGVVEIPSRVRACA
jgi:hypothetical protein